MKVAIIHLSDMHIKCTTTYLTERANLIAKAIVPRLNNVIGIVLALSGDIAFSGCSQEYEIAQQFLCDLKNHIQVRTNTEVKIVLVPGNHDCLIENDTTRNFIVNGILSQRDFSRNAQNGALEVQKDFINFARTMDSNATEDSGEDRILHTQQLKVHEKTIVFQLVNSAWISKKKEVQGELFFPTSVFPERREHGDLVLSMMHHTLSWFESDNSRSLRAALESRSDIVLTGHEHESYFARKETTDGGWTIFIEGSILNDNSNPEKSGFNLLKYDFDNSSFNISKFEFNGELYRSESLTDGWKNLSRLRKIDNRSIRLKSGFEKWLRDVGAGFEKSLKRKLSLDDVYINPPLRNYNQEKKSSNDSYPVDKSDFLFDGGCIDDKILIIGEEKSGRTSLCKMYYQTCLNNSCIPILIDGMKIKSASMSSFRELIEKEYTNQYDFDDLEPFIQLPDTEKVIIIDNFDRTSINQKYRARLLNDIISNFDKILITSSELFRAEEYISSDNGYHPLQDFKQYELVEFGHWYRSRLVNKWMLIGTEEIIEEKELTNKEDEAKNVINTVVGKNYIPSYPFFLLTLLQTYEKGKAYDLKESSYGFYYEFLITGALSSIDVRNKEIDSYYNFLTELAHYIWLNNGLPLDDSKIEKFIDRYKKEYSTSARLNQYINNLIAANLVTRSGLGLSFRYKYIYYYFNARYINTNLYDEPVRNRVKELIGNLHIEENANIIMFLTHLSKDPFILNEILTTSKKIFSEMEPCKLEPDEITIINSLSKELPKLVLENVDFREWREAQDKSRDEVLEKENINSQTTQDEADNSILNKLFLSFKTLEILGQVLKNHYGSLKEARKNPLATEVYDLGLRSLNVFFKVLNNFAEVFAIEVKNEIKEQKIVDGERKVNTAKRMLFSLCESLAFSFIKKISTSVGSEDLKITFENILADNPYTSYKLIDIAIKLDFYKQFPIVDIEKLKNDFSNNVLAYSMLRRLVVYYLYMFPTDYKEKQKICNILEISMTKQRAIGANVKTKKVLRK